MKVPIMQTTADTSERIKDLRVEKRLTLEQLAEQTELSSPAIGKYVAGTRILVRSPLRS